MNVQRQSAAAPALARRPATEAAMRARLIVAITFHFDASRLKFLADVLQSLAQFPVAAVRVIIVTNANEDQRSQLENLCADLPQIVWDVRPQTGLSTPWHLTWRHKQIIKDEFLRGASDYTHFVYLEGDIRFTFANFHYWVANRETLRDRGLLPGFLRFEWNTSASEFSSSDMFWPVYAPAQAYAQVGDKAFVNMPNPYNPLFILDRELAQEYVASASFHETASLSACSTWGLAERAAMGLCHENVPAPFSCRYVVEVRPDSRVPPGTFVWHLPNNYADNPQSALGKVPLRELLAGCDRLFDRSELPVGMLAEPLDGLDELLRVHGERRDWFVLISEHDTIAYFDPVTRRLRHAPIGIKTPNLVFQWRDRAGDLLVVDRMSWRALTSISQDGGAEIAAETEEPLEIEYYRDDSVSLRTAGLFLGADLDGFVRANRTRCLQWERYRLVPFPTLCAMSLMRKRNWSEATDGETFTLSDQPIDFGRPAPSEASALAAKVAAGSLEQRRHQEFGPVRFALTDRTVRFRVHWEPEPISLTIEQSGRQHVFIAV